MHKISAISHSKYYKYFSSISVKNYKSNEIRDLEIKENILKAYNFKVRKKVLYKLK